MGGLACATAEVYLCLRTGWLVRCVTSFITSVACTDLILNAVPRKHHPRSTR